MFGGHVSKHILYTHKLRNILLDDPIQCHYEENTTHNQCNENYPPTQPSQACVHRYDALILKIIAIMFESASCVYSPDTYLGMGHVSHSIQQQPLQCVMICMKLE